MNQPSDQSGADSIIGKLVIEQGLASPDEVEQCQTLLSQKRSESAAGDLELSLSQILVAEGVVTEKQIKRLKPKVEEERDQKTQQIPGFVIKKRLGAGAMATVYLARQISLDREVAIKVLPRKFTNNEDFVQRFYAEGKAAAKLNHPNIVAAYDVGQAGEFHYFVMEYVDGKTVYDDIAKGDVYSEKATLDIALQTAKALDHAHQAGLIHRDVKPKNIMITKDGIAKLADMGLARAVSDREAAESEAGKAFGTPYYISPEQIRGEIDVDFRCDIYGLGATLYHMVTGRVPFDGPSPSAVMHKHLKEPLTPPDHINASLSAGISEIIETCMAKDRNKRYATTSDLLHDLEAVARGEAPLQARRKIDLGSLAAMEEAAGTDEEQRQENSKAATAQGAPLTEQPIFWAAVVGWIAAALCLVLAIVGFAT